jgi:hypothetical protein
MLRSSNDMGTGMTLKRYLVLIHFASKISRNPEAASQVRAIRDMVRRELRDAEAILNAETALAFCGMSALDAHGLWKALRLLIAREDTLSVIEISTNIASSQPALSSWQVQTRWLAGADAEPPVQIVAMELEPLVKIVPTGLEDAFDVLAAEDVAAEAMMSGVEDEPDAAACNVPG